MKKNITYLFAIVTSLFIIALSPVSAGTKETLTSEEIEKNIEKTQLAQQVESSIKQSYSSSFAGLYISDDSENLIVQLKKEESFDLTSQASLIANNLEELDNSIIIEYVENSYEELNEVNNKIIEYFTSDNVEYTNLSANYVDVKENVVIVELFNNTKEQQEKFNNIVFDGNSYDFVVFRSSDGLENTYTLQANNLIKSYSNEKKSNVLGKNIIGNYILSQSL